MKLQIVKEFNSLGEPYYIVVKDGIGINASIVFEGDNQNKAIENVTKYYNKIKEEYLKEKHPPEIIYEEEL